MNREMIMLLFLQRPRKLLLLLLVLVWRLVLDLLSLMFPRRVGLTFQREVALVIAVVLLLPLLLRQGKRFLVRGELMLRLKMTLSPLCWERSRVVHNAYFAQSWRIY